MKSKRKLLILVLVMMFIMVSVVATIALIFAATQQTITTTLNMTYTAENIYGSVKGSYTIGGVTEKLTASTGGEDLVFRGEPLQNGTLSFPTEQIDMTSEASEMILQYTFTNSGRRHYIATMSFESVIEPYNMKIQYSIDGDVYSDQRYAVVVQDESTRSYWIKISVDNKADNASFKGDFIWNLEDTEDMDEDEYLSLASLTFQGSDGAYSASISEAGDFVGAITFPDNVNGDKITTISASTMSDADKAKVTSVYIPDSVETIGESAFESFTKLEEVTFEQNEVAGSSSVSAQSEGGLKKIGDFAFMSCSSLTSFVVLNTVNSVGENLFAECSSLKNVTIQEGATRISTSMFRDCVLLTNIVIPDSVIAIGSSAFARCISLRSVEIGKGLTNLYSGAFSGCTNLESIVISTDNTKYKTSNNCIIETASKTLYMGIATCVIPNDGSVITIGDSAFAECENLTKIEIPSNVQKISMMAFYGCKNLKEVTISETVIRLAASAFSGCTNLTNVTFENPNGWLAGTSEISSNILSDPLSAAQYLKSSTYDSYFIRN